MALKRPTAGGTDGKRRARRPRAEPSASSMPCPPDRERHLVNVDPWAMLFDQLVEAQEEGTPAGRERGEDG